MSNRMAHTRKVHEEMQCNALIKYSQNLIKQPATLDTQVYNTKDFKQKNIVNITTNV